MKLKAFRIIRVDIQPVYMKCQLRTFFLTGRIILIQSNIASVAYQSGIRERDINEWTVREFENRRKAIQRDKRYQMYGTAELSGMVSFKKGNPAPCWEFDIKADECGTMPLSEIGKVFNK